MALAKYAEDNREIFEERIKLSNYMAIEEENISNLLTYGVYHGNECKIVKREACYNKKKNSNNEKQRNIFPQITVRAVNIKMPEKFTEKINI